MLRDYLASYAILTEEEIERFLNMVVPFQLKKGSFFIAEGKTCQHVAFVQSGVLRSFYHSTETEEITYCFTFENTLTTAYTSWITQEPTVENVQALADTELLLISKDQVRQLEGEYPNWIKFFKHIAEQEFVNLERRVFQFQHESAEKRYLDLLNNHPEYLNAIPLQYLASFLGVTQRHLSRIRKHISF